MAVYSVTQDFDDIFERYRRGTAMVLNPERLVITVDGDHSGDGEYSKFSGDSFELADMQIKGDYRGGQPRTFMYDLHEIIAENTGGYAKQIVNENMQYDRSLHGWWVDWDAIGYELENVCIPRLIDTVLAQQPPVKTETQYKKNYAGYGTQTLYATGQLVECIHAEVL